MTDHEVGSSTHIKLELAYGTTLDSDSWRKRTREKVGRASYFVGLPAFTTAFLGPPIEVLDPLRTGQLRTKVRPTYSERRIAKLSMLQYRQQRKASKHRQSRMAMLPSAVMRCQEQ